MIRHERVKYPPRGMIGGISGAPGVDMVDGVRIPAKSVISLRTNQIVTFDTPGGGGMFAPRDRDRSALALDLRDGVVTPDAARRDYGLAEADVASLLAERVREGA